MHLIMYCYIVYCTSYFVKTKEREINKVKTIIVNTQKNIHLDFENEKVDLDFLRNKIVNMSDDEYSKLIFTDQYEEYLEDSCMIVIANLSPNCFSSKRNIILCGCRNNYSIGSLYFCKCQYNRCGVVCEHEKNHSVLNILILLCILALLINLRARPKLKKVFVNRNCKQKTE